MAKTNHILVLNCGSSSIKATIFEKKTWTVIHNTYIENVKNHTRILKNFFKQLKKSDPELFENITKVGHRVVHGGEKYTKPTRINEKVLKELEKLIPLAPLHNPANIAGIKASQKLFPDAKHYAVFDTAFYSTLPEKAYLYALPYSLYKERGVRRYGFHGTSHEYVINEALQNLGPVPPPRRGRQVRKNSTKENTRIISCHLGNGASITASINGVAIDTSMGFTPLEGIPMGTRSGDIDPAIVFFLEKHLHGKFSLKKLQKVQHILEKESGLKGVSELSHDMRDLRDAFFKTTRKAQSLPCEKRSKATINKRHNQAKRALDLYCYRIAKYIGAYAAAMNGIDAIIFTATIGEHADYIRKWVCEYLNYFGLKLDQPKNRRTTNPKKLTEIHDKKSKVKVLVIPTNEALQIAKQG